jgi:hypothetical protein
MFDWLQQNSILCGFLFAGSVLMFIGSLIAVPWLIVRIPADYFMRQRHYVDRWLPRRPALRIVFLGIKNCFGGLLVLAGIVMLIAPGQGLLTILVGLLFLDFPGKFALERRVVLLPPIHQTINWIRAKTGQPPLELQAHRDATDGG